MMLAMAMSVTALTACGGEPGDDCAGNKRQLIHRGAAAGESTAAAGYGNASERFFLQGSDHFR